jgi:hypothetical protein
MQQESSARFDLLTKVTVKIALFWNVTPLRQVEHQL